MEFTTLGRTGRTVSRLGFGGAPAGLTNYLDNYSPANLDQREQVIAAIERAVALGITYFDTAPGYGSGASEAIFGEALADAGDEIFVATKINRDEPNVRAGIEASLTRLRRDQLDLVQIHGSSYSPDLAASILGDGGLLAQLEALREEGLIRHLGFTSEDNNGAVFQFIGCNRFDVMQICYNLLHQHAYEPTRPLAFARSRQSGHGHGDHAHTPRRDCYRSGFVRSIRRMSLTIHRRCSSSSFRIHWLMWHWSACARWPRLSATSPLPMRARRALTSLRCTPNMFSQPVTSTGSLPKVPHSHGKGKP
ncbi:MAG: aldo/keto reductase [Caldilineaceae bacterium]